MFCIQIVNDTYNAGYASWSIGVQLGREKRTAATLGGWAAAISVRCPDIGYRQRSQKKRPRSREIFGRGSTEALVQKVVSNGIPCTSTSTTHRSTSKNSIQI